MITTEEVVVAMRFGRFGREDNTLIMVTKSGALVVQILKRTAKFTVREIEPEKMASGARLIVPKKTKLFVDQTMREREQFLGKQVSLRHLIDGLSDIFYLSLSLHVCPFVCWRHLAKYSNPQDV